MKGVETPLPLEESEKKAELLLKGPAFTCARSYLGRDGSGTRDNRGKE
jgi:hypothetical protein